MRRKLNLLLSSVVGVDLNVIVIWLGHESSETTQIYLHADMLTCSLKNAHSRAPMRAAPCQRDTSLPTRYSPSLRAFDNADNLNDLEQRSA